MFKKFAISLLWLISPPLCIYTLFTYLLAYTLFFEHWLAGFIMMSLPMAMLGCVLLAISWLFVRPSKMILPIIVLLIGYPFIRRTVGFHFKSEEKENTFRILSYNVYGFHHSDYWTDKSPKMKAIIKQSIDYSVNTKAEIKCLQEYYNMKSTPRFSTLDSLRKDNPYYALISPWGPERVFSLGIFSKYPIIQTKKSTFGSLNGNGYIMADIARKNDTIRVINIQLQSMGIRVGRVVTDIKENAFNKAENQAKDIYYQLKNGFISHSKEIKMVEKLIDNSPYPVFVCGDFNETPYGNAYGNIRDRLNNAFEEAGNGFGFTLNRSPKFVRIDNQFCSESIEVLNFETHRHIPYSDHFPTLGTYRIKK